MDLSVSSLISEEGNETTIKLEVIRLRGGVHKDFFSDLSEGAVREEIPKDFFSKLSEGSVRFLKEKVNGWGDICHHFNDALRVFSIDSNFNSDFKMLYIACAWKENSLNIAKLSSLYGASIQKKYSRYLHASIILGALYRKKHQLSFWQELMVFSVVRQRIAKNLHSKDSTYYEKVGSPRIIQSKTTELRDFYADVPEKMRALLLSLGNLEHNLNSNCIIKLIDNDRVIQLSTVPLFSNTGDLIHAPVESIPVMLNIVESIYNRVIMERNKEEIVRLSGEIYWGICQASPWVYGEPSIAEMLFRSIWEMKEMKNPSWKNDVIPWVEVVTAHSISGFGEKFSEFFNWDSSDGV